MNSRELDSKIDQRKSISEFIDFISKDHLNQTKRLTRDKTEDKVYHQLCPDDDEIIRLEEQMYNLEKSKKSE